MRAVLLDAGMSHALSSLREIDVSVRGVSMMPTVWPRTVVRVVASRERRAELGEVVMFRHPHGCVALHRVVSIRKAWVTTWGDGRFHPDPKFPSDQILGTVQGLPLGPFVWRRAPRWCCRVAGYVAVLLIRIRVLPIIGRSVAAIGRAIRRQAPTRLAPT